MHAGKPSCIGRHLPKMFRRDELRVSGMRAHLVVYLPQADKNIVDSSVTKPLPLPVPRPCEQSTVHWG